MCSSKKAILQHLSCICLNDIYPLCLGIVKTNCKCIPLKLLNDPNCLMISEAFKTLNLIIMQYQYV